MANVIKKIVPMLDRILIQRFDPVTTSKGGIVLPEKSVSKVLQGTVIAVGPGRIDVSTGKHMPMGVNTGDRVLLPDYGGTKVELADDSKEYILYRESEILAKLQ